MHPSTEVGQMYTAADVARLFQISERAVRRLVATGHLPYVQISPGLRRYPRDVVDRMVRGEPEPTHPCP